jgi:hypothetical protein
MCRAISSESGALSSSGDVTYTAGKTRPGPCETLSCGWRPWLSRPQFLRHGWRCPAAAQGTCGGGGAAGRNLGGTALRAGALLEVYTQVNASGRQGRLVVCKTVGLAAAPPTRDDQRMTDTARLRWLAGFGASRLARWWRRFRDLRRRTSGLRVRCSGIRSALSMLVNTVLYATRPVPVPPDVGSCRPVPRHPSKQRANIRTNDLGAAQGRDRPAQLIAGECPRRAGR